MVQALATGTTVSQDRIKPSQRWLLYLHFAPSTLLRRDSLHYEKSFESVDLQLHLPRTYFFFSKAPFIASCLLSPEISSPIRIYTLYVCHKRTYIVINAANLLVLDSKCNSTTDDGTISIIYDDWIVI